LQQLILNLFKKFDYEEVQGLKDSMQSIATSRERALQKELATLDQSSFDTAEEFQGYVAHLQADQEFMSEVGKLTDELVILALHKKLEITIRKLLTRFYPALKESELHKIDYLRKNLRFDIATLPSFAFADELRLINNAIKHQGIVTAALAKYPNWVKGRPLDLCGDAFERIAPEIGNYIEEFCEAVRKDLNL
jgi:hypothetical protein